MGIDLSIFYGYTGSTSMLLAASAASRAAKAKAAADGTSTTAASTANVTTPWDAKSASGTATSQLVAALQTKDFINANDTSFDQPGVSADYKKLFALYKGLSTLQTIANSAASTTTLSGQLPGLDSRFQAGYAQVLSYAQGLTLDTATLLAGSKQSVAQTAATVSRASSSFLTRNVIQGDVQQPVAGLENASPFTISVKRGNATIDVAIDLDNMGTATRSLGNVVNYINAQLGAAGVQTRLARVDTTPATVTGQAAPAKTYAVQVNNIPSEQLTFTADAPSTALYLANQGTTGGELRKLNVDGGAPTTVVRTAIAASSGDINIKKTVTDANGNVFVLSTGNADQGSELNQSSSDVMLRKYDSAGNLLWSKLLGASTAADGLALATDSKGAAVIAGQITGQLGTAPSAGGKDSFVVKIGANGEEVFARQVGSVLDDSATALAIGPDDAIYVGGQVKGRLAGASGTVGGTDGYIIKYGATGTRAYSRQFGSTGEDRVSGLAIDGNGDVVVASVEGGQGVVRKFSGADATSPASWTQNIGDLQSGGNIAGLAIDNGKIYIAGSTANAALGGGDATVTNTHGAGQDGFVYSLTDNGSSASAGFLSFLGSDSSDKINGIAVSNGRIFVAGDTGGSLPGATQTRSGVTNAFAAEFDDTGGLQWASQFGVATGQGYGRGIAVDSGGASALDALGLPKGVFAPQEARTITAQTTARPGDYFQIQIGELTARKITIDPGETMTTLARKVNAVLQLSGKASVVSTSAGQSLKIEPAAGQMVALKAGLGRLDALAGLGLSPGSFVSTTTTGGDAATTTSESTTANPTYALNLKSGYSLATTASAASARDAIAAAMSSIRNAYRDSTMDPALKKQLADQAAQTTKGKTGGTVPAYLQAQLANYQSGLDRLTGGSSSTQTVT